MAVVKAIVRNNGLTYTSHKQVNRHFNMVQEVLPVFENGQVVLLVGQVTNGINDTIFCNIMNPTTKQHSVINIEGLEIIDKPSDKDMQELLNTLTTSYYVRRGQKENTIDVIVDSLYEIDLIMETYNLFHLSHSKCGEKFEATLSK